MRWARQDIPNQDTTLDAVPKAGGFPLLIACLTPPGRLPYAGFSVKTTGYRKGIGRWSVIVAASQSSFVARERNLITRVLVGVIAGPIVLGVVMLGGPLFVVLMGIATGVALLEFYRLVRHERRFPLIMTLGVIYIGGPFLIGVLVRLTPPNGLRWVFTVLLANWATDTGAYIGGRWFGKHPLAPKVSPKKTVEGAVVGVLSSTVVGSVVLALFGAYTVRTAPIPFIVGVASVVGDLIESAIKRHYAVKDTGQLIPGHGGMLDRIDGTLLAILTTALYLLVTGGV